MFVQGSWERLKSKGQFVQHASTKLTSDSFSSFYINLLAWAGPLGFAFAFLSLFFFFFPSFFNALCKVPHINRCQFNPWHIMMCLFNPRHTNFLLLKQCPMTQRKLDILLFHHLQLKTWHNSTMTEFQEDFVKVNLGSCSEID